MGLDKLPSRGRAVILCGVAFFFAAQLALNFTIERWRPEWSDPEYGYRFRNLQKQIQSDPQRPLLIVLGSSRIGNGFNSDCIPPDSEKWDHPPLIFNMSLAGGGPIYELLLLKRMLAAGIHPRWIVIEILAPYLNSEGQVLATPDPIPPNRLRWSDLEVLDRHAPHSFWHRHRKWLETYMVPWYSNRYCLLTRYAPTWLEPAKTRIPQFWRSSLTSHGWLPFPLESVTREDYEKGFQHARDQYESNLANFRVSPEADRLLREMLSTCRQERIEVIGLLRMPESTEFKKLYPPEAVRQIDTYLRDLCREKHIQLIDASGWISDDCFVDGHHLLQRGALRFTLRLWNEVLEPHIRKQTSSHADLPTTFPPTLAGVDIDKLNLRERSYGSDQN